MYPRKLLYRTFPLIAHFLPISLNLNVYKFIIIFLYILPIWLLPNLRIKSCLKKQKNNCLPVSPVIMYRRIKTIFNSNVIYIAIKLIQIINAAADENVRK